MEYVILILVTTSFIFLSRLILKHIVTGMASLLPSFFYFSRNFAYTNYTLTMMPKAAEINAEITGFSLSGQIIIGTVILVTMPMIQRKYIDMLSVFNQVN